MLAPGWLTSNKAQAGPHPSERLRLDREGVLELLPVPCEFAG
jgi:hypothetical protein